jgi:hypothetical protein
MANYKLRMARWTCMVDLRDVWLLNRNIEWLAVRSTGGGGSVMAWKEPKLASWAL